MTPCLTGDELKELARADAPASGGRFAEHLRACETCRAEVASRQAAGRSDEDSAKPRPPVERRRTERRAPPRIDDDGPPRDEIEGYELVAELHRGGQGVVYKAIQKATNRVVALKVLREGPFASPDQRYRFQREVDLVAKLNHPAIVTIFDSGVARGRAYFVMEYVKGQPLDEYVAGHQLDVRQTLELFLKVCDGIRHAHLRGVIHRDLKPGNVLVDASGQPHVLDFGLAKLAHEDAPPQGAPVTVTGEFVGTLAYCSPEQARGETDLVDIRSDVYSLGVILFKVLTGEFPYPVIGSVAEVLQAVANAEPRKPSSLRKGVSDDVDTIVLEALAKEQDRRYQSVEALARDVEHYLAGRPIEARRDSTFYVLEKTLRRYRLIVGFVVLLAAVLTASGIVLARQAQRIAAERDIAEQARQRSERDAARAEIAATAWYRAWVRDESPVPVLRRSLELNRLAIGENDPALALHLYNLAAALEAESKSDPERADELHAEVDSLLREALALHRRTLPPGDPRILESIDLVARRTPNAAERRALLAEALALRRMTLPPDDPSLVTNLEALAELSKEVDPSAVEQYLREALDVRRLCLPVDAVGAIGAMESLAALLRARGDLTGALDLEREALALRREELPDDREGLAHALLAVGDLLVATDAPQDAEPLLREALELRRAVLPPFDARVAVARTSLGEALVALGQLDEAGDLLAVSLPALEEAYGAADPRTLRAIRALATLHEERGEHAEAQRYRSLLPPE